MASSVSWVAMTFSAAWWICPPNENGWIGKGRGNPLGPQVPMKKWRFGKPQTKIGEKNPKMKVVGSHRQIYTPVVLETTASRLKGKGGPACTFQPKTITNLHLAQQTQMMAAPNVLDKSSPKQMAGSTFFSLFITAKLLRFCTTTCKHSKLPHPGGHLACDCGLEEVAKRVTTLKGIHQGVRIPNFVVSEKNKEQSPLWKLVLVTFMALWLGCLFFG